MKKGGQPCPCASGQDYAACCAPLHGGCAAPTPEALMRSRYSAFTLALEPYLLATWHPDTRPATLDLAADGRTRWLGLSIKATRTVDADHGEVEFVARYRVDGRGQRLHENSRFIRQDGRWFYVDGDIREGKS